MCSFAALTLHTLLGALRALSWQPSLAPQPAKPQPPAQEPKVVANTEESVEKIALELSEE